MIGRQTVEVETSTERDALNLLDRVGDMNRERFLPVIARVLDEFDRPGEVVRIDRLDLSLGVIPSSRLDLAAERLEQALRKALADALDGRAVAHAHGGAPGAGRSFTNSTAVEATPAGAALLQALTDYLLHGTWPYRDAAAADPSALLTGVIDSDPAALADLVRRHRGRPELVARIARQMPFADLERLIYLLEPAYAPAILAAVHKLREAHRRRPLAPLPAPSFARALWDIVLNYVLHEREAGPKARVERRLLQRLERSSIPSAGTEQAILQPFHSVSASEHEGAALPAAPAPLDLLEQFLLYGTMPRERPDALLLMLTTDDPQALARLFRRHARNDALLRRVTEVMGAAALRRLLEVLDPEAAAPIVSYMLEMRELHRAAPVIPVSDPQLARLLWFVALRYVLHETGTHFNRRSFVAGMIDEMANEEGLTYGEVLNALHLGVLEVANAAPVAMSLPAIIMELASAFVPAEAPPDAVLALERMLDRPEQITTATLASMFEAAHAQDAAGLRGLLRRLAARDPAMLVRTAGAAVSTAKLVELMLPPALARHAAVLMTRLAVRPTNGSVHTHEIDSAIVASIAAFDGPAPNLPQLADRIAQVVAAVTGEAPDAVAPAEAPPDALFALQRMLDRPEQISAAVLASMLEAAHAQDAAGLRGLLRRLAARDPARLVRTAGAALSTTKLIELLLPPALARHAAALMARLAARPTGDSVRTHEIDRAIIASIAAFGGPAPDLPQLAVRIAQAVAAVTGEAPGAVAAALRGEGDGGTADQPEPTDSGDEAVAPYRRLDQLRHFLATGVLPWRDVLAEPGLTLPRLLASLKLLPAGAVRAGLAGRAPQASALRRALSVLAQTDVVALIDLMLPSGGGAHDLNEAIAAHAARAADRSRFHAGVLTALIEGRALDLEQLAATAGAETGPADVDAIDALLAELAAGFSQRSVAATARWRTALARLLVIDVAAACRFITTAIATPAGLARLAELCAPPLLGRILVALAPGAAATLSALADALTAATPRDGVEHRDIVAALLTEIAIVEPGAPPAAALIARVLRRIFGATPAAPPPWLATIVRRHVLPKLPRNAATPLTLALASLAPRGPQSPAGAARQSDSAGQHAEWLFRTLAERGLAGGGADTDTAERLSELLGHLLAAPGRDLATRLVAFLRGTRQRERLLRLLPERLLARLIVRAVPHAGASLLDSAEVLARAAGAAGHAIDRATLWDALLQTAAVPSAERTLARLAEHFFAAAGKTHGADARARDAGGAALIEAAARHARDAGRAALVAVIEERRAALAAAFAGKQTASAPVVEHKRKPAPRSSRAKTAFRLGGDEDTVGEPIYIGNAGLVLANPFLPHFFDALGLLVRDDAGKPQLRDEMAASRAVHLLQYLADGRADRPEPLLALNKILCGLPVAAPVEREIEPTEDERAICDKLLRSIIENWPIISTSSVAALRETFLEREGKLVKNDGGWRLQVQRKTLDVLVDQVPWSIGVVFHPWMPAALHVTW